MQSATSGLKDKGATTPTNIAASNAGCNSLKFEDNVENKVARHKAPLPRYELKAATPTRHQAWNQNRSAQKVGTDAHLRGLRG